MQANKEFIISISYNPIKLSSYTAFKFSYNFLQDFICKVVSIFTAYFLEIIYIRRIIEKVKELLVYTEQSLSQIAKALGYQKPTELSEQLMTYTGLTSAHFKQIRKNKLEIIRRQQEKQNEL